MRYEVCEKLTEKEVEKLNKKGPKGAKGPKDSNDSNGPKEKKKSYVEEIVLFLKEHKGECGIVYVLSRQDAGVAWGSK